MAVYYSEYLATRTQAGIGLDLGKDTGKHRFLPDERVEREVGNLVCRYKIYEFDETGYFLFFNDSLKRFVCMQISRGKKVDNRPNMKMVIRIPDITGASDGFEECIMLLKEWLNIQTSQDSYKEMRCQYNVDAEGMVDFAFGLHKQCFEMPNKKIGIKITDFLLNRNDESQFVIEFMQFCYKVLPNAKRNRLNFAWRVPEEKSYGSNLLLSRTVNRDWVYDLNSSGVNHISAENESMMNYIINKVFDEEENSFSDAIYQYFIPVADMENMYWNYQGYLYDTTEKCSCTYPEYEGRKETLKKMIRNHIQKTEDLFWKMIKNLLSQKLAKDQYKVLLSDCIDVINMQSEYQDDQLNDMWTILINCIDGLGRDVYSILNGIRCERLYYAMLAKGLEKCCIDVRFLEEIEGLTTKDAVQGWILKDETRKLREREDVKGMLLDKIKGFVKQDTPIRELQQLIKLGSQIDKNKTLEIVKSYLVTGIKDACRDGSMISYQKYLNHTASIWKGVSSCEALVEEVYYELARNIEFPMSYDEISAFTSVEDFSNVKDVQIILMGKCQDCLNRRIGNSEETEACLKLLLQWKTGISPNETVVLDSKTTLNQRADQLEKNKLEKGSLEELLHYKVIDKEDEVHRYSSWLETLESRVDEALYVDSIIDSLKGKTEFFQDGRTKKILCNILLKLMDGAQEEKNIHAELEILQIASAALDQSDLRKVLGCFWSGTTIEQFPEIYSVSSALWKNGSPLSVNMEGAECKDWYDIYQNIYSDEYIEVVEDELETLINKYSEQQTKKFLKILLLQLGQMQGKAFDRVMHMLLSFWEEETVIKGIQKFYPNPKEANDLIKKVKYFETPLEEDVKSVLSELDIIYGGLLGVLVSVVSILWMNFLSWGNVLGTIGFMFLGIFLSVLFIFTKLPFLKKNGTVKTVSFGITGMVWCVICGIYCLTKGSFLAAGIVSSILLVVQIGWLIKIKRKRG